MAWSFADEIHVLAGLDADSTDDLNSGEDTNLHVNQWLTEGAKEVIIQLPSNLYEKCSDVQQYTDNTVFSFDTANRGKILYCTRHNGTSELPCRLLDAKYAGLADDSTAINYYATANDPAYFLRDNEAQIKPTPDGNGGNFYFLKYPTVLHSDTTITNFPHEAEYLVVLYAAIRAVQDRLQNEAYNEDSEIYGLHADKYVKLNEQYAKGLAALKGA